MGSRLISEVDLYWPLKKPYTYKKDLQMLFYITYIYILRKVVSFLEEYKIIDRRNIVISKQCVK